MRARVHHILLRCALAEHTRQDTRRNLSLRVLLYTNEGIEETVKIWREFEEAKKRIRQREDGIEERDRDAEWGIGGLEK